VVEAIHRYLTTHPDAADSSEGIATWWLPSIGIVASVQEVEVALEQMQALGLVNKRRLGDGRVIYRAASSRNES
jgi:hypothetical protein